MTQTTDNGYRMRLAVARLVAHGPAERRFRAIELLERAAATERRLASFAKRARRGV